MSPAMATMKPDFVRFGRSLLPGQRAELTTIDIDGAGRSVVLIADEVIEAPNWTPDGRWLIFNAGGELWRIAPDGSDGPSRIDTGHLKDLNNDHVLSPDGRLVFISSNDGHIYFVPIDGGQPERVSNTHPHRHHYYLHGISPDGVTLAYTGVNAYDGNPWGKVNIWTIPSGGGVDTALTDVRVPNDGPEFSPDGQWIWFNSEQGSHGHAQLFRMRLDGSLLTQVTFDERVNWFPHFSPDGQHVVYLSYPKGTRGHPPSKDVILRRIGPDGTGMRNVVKLFGGQGTINVNSWAPDSRHFAFVAYPIG